MMSNKTYLNWSYTREWCINNPEKMAAIVTRKGRFEVKYIPNEILEKIVQPNWVSKSFDENK